MTGHRRLQTSHGLFEAPQCKHPRHRHQENGEEHHDPLNEVRPADRHETAQKRIGNNHSRGNQQRPDIGQSEHRFK